MHGTRGLSRPELSIYDPILVRISPSVHFYQTAQRRRCFNHELTGGYDLAVLTFYASLNGCMGRLIISLV